MQDTDSAIIRECSLASQDGRLPFAQIIAKLMATGLEYYHADLYRGETTYYMPDGGSHIEPLVLPAEKIAADFSAAGVEAAVRSSQKGEIKYMEFLQRAAAAGCIGYFVYLHGKRVVYFGRNGDAHTEYFPSK